VSRRGQDSLERRGVFSAPHLSRIVDGGNGRAGVAVSASVRHGLCAGVRIDPLAAITGNRRNGDVGRDGAREVHRGSAGLLAERTVVVLAVAARSVGTEDGDRVSCFEDGLSEAVVELGKFWRRDASGGGSCALELGFACGLLGLLSLLHIA